MEITEMSQLQMTKSSILMHMYKKPFICPEQQDTVDNLPLMSTFIDYSTD